jgi:hypothetical protein
MSQMTSYQLWSTLIRYNLSPNQIYFLDSCRQKIKPAAIINADAEKIICQAKGFITEDNKLTPLALQVLNEFETFLVKTKKTVTSEVLGPDFLTKVNEYRELFPKGKFPSGKLARQNVQDLKDKFVWFFKTFPEYSWEMVLDATDYYLFLEEKKNFQYTVCSSYFIKKTDTITKEIKSPLADLCQMISEDPSILDGSL